MTAKLIVLSGVTEGESFEIPLGRRVTVGNSAGCDALLVGSADGVKLAAIEGSEDGWSLSVEQGFPWIVDSSLIANKKRLPLRENSLIRLSPEGPDLRFRISNVGDATKDIQPKSKKIDGHKAVVAEKDEEEEGYVLAPLPEDSSAASKASAGPAWEPDPEPVESFDYLGMIAPAALILIPLIVILVYLYLY